MNIKNYINNIFIEEESDTKLFLILKTGVLIDYVMKMAIL